MSGFEHLNQAIVDRITRARLGEIVLMPIEITLMWCEITYAYDELRKAQNAISSIELELDIERMKNGTWSME